MSRATVITDASRCHMTGIAGWAAWARSLRDQCQAAGVAFLFKQWGAWKPVSHMTDAELDQIYGRRSIPTAVLHRDGSMHGIGAPFAFWTGTGAMQVFEVGKSAAGRLLDGRTWAEVPTPEPDLFSERTPA